jgi:hypothetical protein
MTVPRSLPIAAWLLALMLPAHGGCKPGELLLAPDPRPFVELARQSPCADRTNRLFVIDGAMVFWDKAGSCADAAYSQTLFGATPEDLLCRYGDSIAGPQKMCKTPDVEKLFDIILAHLDEPNLGLGPSHTVRPIAF